MKALLFVFAIILFFLAIWLYKNTVHGERWGFVGYQYRWSENYVEHDGFKSEEECVSFGDKWIERQTSPDVLFTCSLNPRPSGIPGIDTADKVCEYERSGFVRCRK